MLKIIIIIGSSVILNKTKHKHFVYYHVLKTSMLTPNGITFCSVSLSGLTLSDTTILTLERHFLADGKTVFLP